jgi:two-component system, LytTR family, sensor kinase
MPPINHIYLDSKKRYWLFQLSGWILFVSLIMIITFYSNNPIILASKNNAWAFVVSCVSLCISGILSTHLYRVFIKKTKLFSLNFGRVVFLFFLGLVFASSLLFIFNDYVFDPIAKNMNLSFGQKVKEFRVGEAKKNYFTVLKWPEDYYKKAPYNVAGTKQNDTLNSLQTRFGIYQNTNGEWKTQSGFGKEFLFNLFQGVLVVGPWLLIYFIWHFIERNRRDQIARLKLESTVKELELKTIKSHINPHFIFNALNSIRALVDENPQRARTAVTELSNLLRSSMQAGKLDVVPLEKELSIVKDYLALEHIRFEERLQIEYDIDPETLQNSVPPMMLQTLVENAIKHGISKSVAGGRVIIKSYFENGKHILTVSNTGKLNSTNTLNGEGFGLSSTKNRLNLMYGSDASFKIGNHDNNNVEAEVRIPMSSVL